MTETILSKPIKKCSTCNSITSLDSMVRKDYIVGTYHCIDCEVTRTNENYDVMDKGTFNLYPIHLSRIQKLMEWCFG